jgi:hypothetical protein
VLRNEALLLNSVRAMLSAVPQAERAVRAWCGIGGAPPGERADR